MKKSLLFAFVLFSFSLFSQDFEADMGKIFKKIESSESMSISVDIKLYAEKGGAVIYSANSSLFHHGGKTISKLADMEIYKSDQYEIQVNHEEKIVLIHLMEKNKEEFSSEQLEELKKLINKEKGKGFPYELISNNKGIKTYRSNHINGLDDVTFRINMNQLKIEKVTYKYKESNKTKISYCTLNYTRFDYDKAFTKNYFDVSNYFTIEDQKYILNNKFSNYNLIVR